jgi:hypothetical protein
MMSMQAPTQEGPTAAPQAPGNGQPVEVQELLFEGEFDLYGEEAYPTRPVAALVVLSATTLVTVGALLGARYISRRMARRKAALRLSDRRPRILITLPFALPTISGRRPRWLRQRPAARSLSARIRQIRGAREVRMSPATKLSNRVRQRLAAIR